MKQKVLDQYQSSPHPVHNEKKIGSIPSPHTVHDKTKRFGSTPSPHPLDDIAKNSKWQSMSNQQY